MTAYDKGFLNSLKIDPLTEQPGERGAIRCAGCNTLWKVPPTTLVATMTRNQDPIGAWYELDVGKLLPATRTISDTPCPLCGGTEIDVMRCEVNLEHALRLLP